MPPFAGPSVMLYCTRYPVNTSISPLSIWTGHDTVICRLGCVRIFQMPGSRLSRRAAPSNSCSMAPKTDPCADMSLLDRTEQPNVRFARESIRSEKTRAETRKHEKQNVSCFRDSHACCYCCKQQYDCRDRGTGAVDIMRT